MQKNDIYELIECMAALIRTEERRKCTGLGLQPVHFQVLNYLARCNKYSDTPAATANFLGMTRGTVSQSIIILEKKGYIEKAQDQADKRVVHLKLLAKGREILTEARPTQLFNKAVAILNQDMQSMSGDKVFAEALTALQKANNSNSFGMCKTCKHFSTQNGAFFCQLTQEKLSQEDSEKICQEHTPV
ncbi:MarR family winged helix-turn-helix transcriptional regulator [Methylomarinum sp. Ch1-1]|uniref:MarR family winged helix-turn-helix transcriptional regulator n=1 Tax=Methylomarinum roseum TaxID=3067653 RepID=A0AAU7NPD4_9GAMM|nr:MarR family winged helix-turn-helix transcriptional regulator [Methylomarinum sp. Ch1-1]MDP4521298.1 MarR family winged helix-turn-helix transcriptional regulator [Methylomarinum sp. Ch1-1]